MSPKRLFSTAVFLVLTLGVVLGISRWLGGGAPLFSPEWFSNAANALNGLSSWGSTLSDRYLSGR